MKGLVNWEALQKLSFGPMYEQMNQNPAAMWGQTAVMYNKMAQLEQEYTKRQVDTIIVDPQDTVLDIGCGPGRLAVPIARRARQVTALDVAPQMLEVCQYNACQAGLNNLHTRLLNWNDAVIGANLEQHDVVIASRSVGLHDLVKLNAAARKYVFLLSFAQSPSLKQARDSLFIGASPDIRPIPPMNRMLGYNITFNMLYDLGIDPAVQVVTDGFTSNYKSRLEAYDDLRVLCDFPAENEAVFRDNVDKWLLDDPQGGCTFRIETKTYIMWWQPEPLDI